RQSGPPPSSTRARAPLLGTAPPRPGRAGPPASEPGDGATGTHPGGRDVTVGGGSPSLECERAEVFATGCGGDAGPPARARVLPGSVGAGRAGAGGRVRRAERRPARV